MRKETINYIKDTLICIGLVVAFVFVVNLFFKRNDDLLNNKPGTLTYKVYYTPDMVVTKRVYNVYSYSLNSYRGSNSLQVLKQNCSTWVPIMKHVGLLDSVENTTAPIEVVSFY